MLEETPNIVSWDEFRAFWITWDDGEIKVCVLKCHFILQDKIEGLRSRRPQTRWIDHITSLIERPVLKVVDPILGPI